MQAKNPAMQDSFLLPNVLKSGRMKKEKKGILSKKTVNGAKGAKTGTNS